MPILTLNHKSQVISESTNYKTIMSLSRLAAWQHWQPTCAERFTLLTRFSLPLPMRYIGVIILFCLQYGQYGVFEALFYLVRPLVTRRKLVSKRAVLNLFLWCA